MPVSATSPAPYAPAKAILDIVSRHRAKGMPSPITQEVLGRAGISDSLIPRTMHSLKTLDLIDDKGTLTSTMEALRLAPENEFKQRLGQWLTEAYADVLQFVDPATADEIKLRDAFRNYLPVGQQSRMVILFEGLFAAAGLGPENQNTKRASRQTKPTPAANGSGPTRRPPPPLAAPLHGAAVTGGTGETEVKRHGGAHKLPKLISALVENLPEEGMPWTIEEASDWLQTAAHTFRYAYKLGLTIKVEIQIPSKIA